MNREIKFRAKVNDIKLKSFWEYGGIIHITERYKDEEDFEECDIWQLVNENGVAFDIDKNTIGQYTGLKDKNGVEIYEGDIVKHDAYWQGDCKYPEGYGQVLWDDEDTGFYLTAQNTSCISLFDLTRNLNAEVIGNIYDNADFKEE